MKHAWIALLSSAAIAVAAPENYAPPMPEARLFPVRVINPTNNPPQSTSVTTGASKEGQYVIADGKADIHLTVACSSNDWTLSIQRGKVKYNPVRYAEYDGSVGGSIVEAFTGDLNGDGFADLVMVEHNGFACGLAASRTDNLLLLSDGAGGFRLWQFETYEFSTNDLAAISSKKPCSLMISQFLQAEAPDGKTHSYWIFAPYEIKAASLTPFQDSLWPMWIWFKIKPNHDPTTHFTAGQKEQMWRTHLKGNAVVREIVIEQTAAATRTSIKQSEVHR